MEKYWKYNLPVEKINLNLHIDKKHIIFRNIHNEPYAFVDGKECKQI